MAAVHRGVRDHASTLNDWDRNRKLVVVLMMLLDDEAPMMLERQVWCRQWLLRRTERGAYHTIFKELAVEDTPGFAEYMRMPHTKFVALVEAVAPFIKKQETCMRESIQPSERVALAIRYLATGETFQSLSFQFRIGTSTISCIVMEVCVAIYRVFGKEYLKTPNTSDKWNEIAQLFYSRWNIPNTIGAIDGKRILIQKPARAGSHFHDYKGNESIIALVMVGPEYECLFVDVGTNGRNPDGHAWHRCSLKKALESCDNPLNIPPLRPLPGATKPIPFVLTGDEAFPLSKHMLKPYPRRNLTVEERIANYRISRGRRISENILGILGNKWRCFRAPFLLQPEKVQQITMAILTLHNWLRDDRASRSIYCPPTLIDREDPNTWELIPGSWRDDLPPESLLPLQPALVHNYTSEAKEMRQEFTRWFSDEGDVEWQRRMCGL